jgi:hypothetical protein
LDGEWMADTGMPPHYFDSPKWPAAFQVIANRPAAMNAPMRRKMGIGVRDRLYNLQANSIAKIMNDSMITKYGWSASSNGATVHYEPPLLVIVAHLPTHTKPITLAYMNTTKVISI